jgi:hypothetical protein
MCWDGRTDETNIVLSKSDEISMNKYSWCFLVKKLNTQDVFIGVAF